jgi:uncharacterized membrane protein
MKSKIANLVQIILQMHFLFLTVVTTVGIFVSFRYFAIKGINLLPAILTNYATCALLSLLSSIFLFPESLQPQNWSWVLPATALGLFFFPVFILMAHTTKVQGITVSTVANKLSMLIPALVNLIFWRSIPPAQLPTFFIGLGLGSVAIFFLTERASRAAGQLNPQPWLPVLVFIGSGIVDLSINEINRAYAPPPTLCFAVLFSMAFVSGMLYRTFWETSKDSTWGKKEIKGGIMLGIPNFLSLLFLVYTLNLYNNNGAIVFPLVNIFVILSSALLTLFVFRESLSKRQWIGIGLSILAIAFITGFTMG